MKRLATFVVSLALVAGFAGADDKPGPDEVANDDGQSAGMKSIAGAGHAVKLTSPSDGAMLTAIKIYGSRYGYPKPPAEDFHVWLLDGDLNPIEDFTFPYSKFARGDAKWVTLQVKPTKLPEDFAICVGFNPEQTKGVYVHHDAEGGEKSLVGLPDDGFKPYSKGDWMIRAVVKEAGAK